MKPTVIDFFQSWLINNIIKLLKLLCFSCSTEVRLALFLTRKLIDLTIFCKNSIFKLINRLTNDRLHCLVSLVEADLKSIAVGVTSGIFVVFYNTAL